MRQDCGKCGGRGFVEPEAQVEVKVRKKPGRKPKSKVCLPEDLQSIQMS